MQKQLHLHRRQLPETMNGETYTYNADDGRVAKTVGGVTTVFF